MYENYYYLWSNIRTLLSEGFTDDELRRLAFDLPDSKPVYDQLTKNTSKDEIIDRLIVHADQKLQVENLLALAKERNPARYDKHRPYHYLTSIKPPTLDIDHEKYKGHPPVPQITGQFTYRTETGILEIKYAGSEEDFRKRGLQMLANLDRNVALLSRKVMRGIGLNTSNFEEYGTISNSRLRSFQERILSSSLIINSG